MTIRRKDNQAVALISAAQDLTDSWANLGEVIDVRDVESIAVWLKLDINDSQNARFRIVGKQTETASDNYLLPIKTVSASDVKVEAEYYEFNADADANMVFEIGVSDLVPFIQVQVEAGVVGATAGQIDEAYVTFMKVFKK